MPIKKLLHSDPLTGITQVFHHDESVDAKNFVIQTVQDTTPIVETNKREFNEAPSHKLGANGENFVKVASIPLTIYHELRKKGIAQDPAAMKRWLNDPDNRYFRSRPGVV